MPYKSTRPTTAIDYPGSRRRAIADIERVRTQFKYEDIKAQDSRKNISPEKLETKTESATLKLVTGN
jgi:hypothetical protein